MAFTQVMSAIGALAVGGGAIAGTIIAARALIYVQKFFRRALTR